MKSAKPNEPPIACTLDSDTLQERKRRISQLAASALRSHSLQERTLLLHYAPEASAEVRALVQKERECCAFLTFVLEEADDGIHLTITAPAAAGESASLLFSHFAPHAEVVTAVARFAAYENERTRVMHINNAVLVCER